MKNIPDANDITSNKRLYIVEYGVRGKKKTNDRRKLVETDSIEKHINDNYGHKAGDELLGMVAAAIEANLGKGDFAFRVGGDEFAIICNKTDEARAKKLVQKLHFELSGLYLHGVMLSASIGYACVKDNSKEIPQMYKEADHMMYEHKRKYHEICAKQKAVEAESR